MSKAARWVLAIVAGLALLCGSRADAGRATCADIAAAKAAGASDEQITSDLATTSARIAACANSAQVRARHEARRARRAERREGRGR